jgi:hypothetical protein
MKKIIFILILNFSLISIAQEKYKYAIIPIKFTILKKENQYNLNTISKKMLESYGLETYFENQLPNNINTCETLKIDIEEDSSIFATKLFIIFKDCRNQVIFKSDEGKSREKELKFSYNEAFRNASKSIEKFDFLNKNNSKSNFKISESNIKLIKETKNEVLNDLDIITNIKTNIVIKDMKLQNTNNGYYLINNYNEKILQLFKTSNPSVFIVKNNDYHGVANISFKTCKVEYYINEELNQITYSIE